MENKDFFSRFQGLSIQQFQELLSQKMSFPSADWIDSWLQLSAIIADLSEIENLSAEYKWEWFAKITDCYFHCFSKRLKEKIKNFHYEMKRTLGESKKNNHHVSDSILKQLSFCAFEIGDLEFSSQLICQISPTYWESFPEIKNQFVIAALDIAQLVSNLRGLLRRNHQKGFVEVYLSFYYKLMSTGSWDHKRNEILESLLVPVKMYLAESSIKQLVIADLQLLQDLCMSGHTQINVPIFRRRKELLLLFYYRFEYEFGIYTSLKYAYASKIEEVYNSYLRLFKDHKDKKLNLNQMNSIKILLQPKDISEESKIFADHGIVSDPYIENEEQERSREITSHEAIFQVIESPGSHEKIPIRVNIADIGIESHKIYIDTQKHLGKWNEAIRYIRKMKLNKDFYWGIEEAELLFTAGKLAESLATLWNIPEEKLSLELRKSYYYLYGKILKLQKKYQESYLMLEKVYLLDKGYLQVKRLMEELDELGEMKKR